MSQAAADAVLAALAGRTRVDAPVAVVVAHPDDETIGAGASLCLLRNLILVHVTDGAPRDLRDARRAGFHSCAAYATARASELQAALRTGSVRPRQTIAMGVPDQGASERLQWLTQALRRALAGVAAVLTHAFEGGHPDHDAVAFAVQATGLPAIEMAGYHADAQGGIAVGRFLPGNPERAVVLTTEERARRDGMLACFATQAATLAPFFGLPQERFRLAPRYDFAAPRPAPAYYDQFDWGMTSARWRALAAAALPC